MSKVYLRAEGMTVSDTFGGRDVRIKQDCSDHPMDLTKPKARAVLEGLLRWAHKRDPRGLEILVARTAQRKEE